MHLITFTHTLTPRLENAINGRSKMEINTFALLWLSRCRHSFLLCTLIMLLMHILFYIWLCEIVVFFLLNKTSKLMTVRSCFFTSVHVVVVEVRARQVDKQKLLWWLWWMEVGTVSTTSIENISIEQTTLVSDNIHYISFSNTTPATLF